MTPSSRAVWNMFRLGDMTATKFSVIKMEFIWCLPDVAQTPYPSALVMMVHGNLMMYVWNCGKECKFCCKARDLLLWGLLQEMVLNMWTSPY